MLGYRVPVSSADSLYWAGRAQEQTQEDVAARICTATIFSALPLAYGFTILNSYAGAMLIAIFGVTTAALSVASAWSLWRLFRILSRRAA